MLLLDLLLDQILDLLLDQILDLLLELVLVIPGLLVLSSDWTTGESQLSISNALPPRPAGGGASAPTVTHPG